MSTEFNATVNAALLHAVSLFTSTETTRYYLAGVHIEKHPHMPGALLVATDGHRMLIAHDKDATVTGSAIIPVSKPMLSELARVKKEWKSIAADRFTFVLDGKTAQIGIGQDVPRNVATLPAERIDGTFPDWRRVTKTEHAGENKAGTICFNVDLAASFVKAEAIAQGYKNEHSALQLWASNAEDPMIIRFNDKRLHGILMPVRGDSEYTAPYFL